MNILNCRLPTSDNDLSTLHFDVVAMFFCQTFPVKNRQKHTTDEHFLLPLLLLHHFLPHDETLIINEEWHIYKCKHSLSLQYLQYIFSVDEVFCAPSCSTRLTLSFSSLFENKPVGFVTYCLRVIRHWVQKCLVCRIYSRCM